MVTSIHNSNLSSTLFGKTRRAVLLLLYSHTGESFYLRQIVRATGAGLGPLQRELKKLTEAGIILRTVQGKQVYFQANTKSPVFNELKSLIIKTVGISDTLRNVLSPLINRIKIAFIYGSFASGKENTESDIDLVIIGDIPFGEVVAALHSAEEILNREINPTLYSNEEFRLKLKEGHHFLKNVLGNPKIFIIGDEDELERLAH